MGHPLLFRYPGGKHYAIKNLKIFWDSIHHDEYREIFFGGGSVFFNKLKTSFNWINDIDNELITTLKIIQSEDSRLQLLELLKNEVASKERWKEVFHFQPSTNLEIAYKYFYLNRTSFSGKLISPSWGYRPKRSLPPERWHERINPCGRKLEGVKITSTDFESLITQKPIKVDNKVLIFADPPYFSPSKKKHYRFGFTHEDHIRLMDCLKKCQYPFFLTYDDVPEIHEIYDWANIYNSRFFYRVGDSNSANGLRRLGFELVITNFDIR